MLISNYIARFIYNITRCLALQRRLTIWEAYENQLKERKEHGNEISLTKAVAEDRFSSESIRNSLFYIMK